MQKVLHNPKIVRIEVEINGQTQIKDVNGVDIVNYKIEEAEFDSNGKMIIDPDTGRGKWTGNTLEWTINAGETLEFPDYVADYLKSIYPFLQEGRPAGVGEVKPSTPVAEDKPVAPEGTQPSSSVSGFICKFCQRNFKTQNQLGVHIGVKHFDQAFK